MFDLMTTLHWKYASFHLETGYNFWWRDSEKIKLVKAFDDNVGVIGVSSTQSANNAVITDAVGVTPAAGFDANFQALTTSKLDLNSAAHKSASSHKLFAGLALDYKFAKAPSTELS